MPGKYLRGALIHLTEAFLLPVPNVIVFQYNPESLTHTWTPPAATPHPDAAEKLKAGQVTEGNPLAASGYPGESFGFTISMNSTDTVADGGVATAAIATVSGLATRLAALEMLQYPVTEGNVGALTGTVQLASLTGGAFGQRGGQSRMVPQMVVPPVLFAWGAGRIVPVRVTTLTITEMLYDPLLNPTHADAKLGLKVLTPTEMSALGTVFKQIMQGAYAYTHVLRQALATANLVNAADSVIGLV